MRPVRPGRQRAQDAELVAFRVGQHRPRLAALAHVGPPGAQGDEPGHLRLDRAVSRPDVQVQAVLDRLAFRHGHEHERRDYRGLAYLLGQISWFPRPRGDLHLPVRGPHHVIAQHSGPERGLGDRVLAVDNDLGEPASHDHSWRPPTIEELPSSREMPMPESPAPARYPGGTTRGGQARRGIPATALLHRRRRRAQLRPGRPAGDRLTPAVACDPQTRSRAGYHPAGAQHPSCSADPRRDGTAPAGPDRTGRPGRGRAAGAARRRWPRRTHWPGGTASA